jgi:hypothetical protein
VAIVRKKKFIFIFLLRKSVSVLFSHVYPHLPTSIKVDEQSYAMVWYASFSFVGQKHRKHILLLLKHWNQARNSGDIFIRVRRHEIKKKGTGHVPLDNFIWRRGCSRRDLVHGARVKYQHLYQERP